MGYAIGVDVGGTFTDFLLMDGAGAGRIYKVLSTPDDASQAVFNGFERMAADEGISLEDFLGAVERIVHGTTVTTNAVLTGNTVPTGLLSTRGFRDALEMRRGIREVLYDNKYKPPAPIVPRWLRRPVTGRIDQAGTEVEPFAVHDIDAAAAIFDAAGIRAVAICFMHAYANGAHEHAAAARLRELMPDAYVSVSSQILPQVRFYERTSTTVLNAAVGPILKRYIDRLADRLTEAGFEGALLIMQSNGGVTSPEVAVVRAATTLLSGPAAGPIAGLAYAEGQGEDSFITIDMGGTSFEASLVRGGAPAITTTATINRFAMALPSMDIKTIGAGGGSIAWIDNGGLLRMGPESAGAKPGPVCYGLGGAAATCSDANLVLGYLSADFFAGGSISLDIAAARQVIQDQVAKPLGLGLIEAAAGMHRVMNVNMASAIREISIERGHDPRDLPLICAGGAGAIHAAAIARELGIGRILVPREASIFCAAGMLRTDLRHDYVRSYATVLAGNLDVDRLNVMLAEMETDGNRTLEAEGIEAARRHFRYALDMRYLGQYHEVRIEDVPEPALKNFDLSVITSLFHREHDRLYGYALEDEGTVVELVNVRLSAIGVTDKPPLEPTRAAEGPDAAHARKGHRPAYLPSCGTFADVAVYDGDALGPGNRMAGPALVETPVTTIFVPDGFDLTVDNFGTAVMSAGDAGDRR